MFEEKLVQEIIDSGDNVAENIMNAHNETMKNFCDWLQDNIDPTKTPSELLDAFISS